MALEPANIFINTHQQLQFASTHPCGSWNDSLVFNDRIRYVILQLTLNKPKRIVCSCFDGNVFICKQFVLFFPVPFGTKPCMVSIGCTLMYRQQSSSSALKTFPYATYRNSYLNTVMLGISIYHSYSELQNLGRKGGP